jgi:hypothetical protein
LGGGATVVTLRGLSICLRIRISNPAAVILAPSRIESMIAALTWPFRSVTLSSSFSHIHPVSGVVMIDPEKN